MSVWPPAALIAKLAAMARRLVHHSAITERRGAPNGMVAPEDFTLSLRAASTAPYLPRGALAYCADIARERVLFTCHAQDDVPAMFEAPFLYLAQLRTAGSVISVPLERLDELGLAEGAAAAVFVFSPGRAGTTLLARLLTAAGVPCASEPDMLTQAVCLTETQRQMLPPGMDVVLATTCIGSLGRVLGRGAFIKLRSQCNEGAMTLVGAAPGSRVVFMMRGARSWAFSRHRAFAEPPNHLAMLLRHAMEALDAMIRAGVQVDILWFETLVADPLAALRLCAPEARPDPARIAEVMARDSQGGTLLARELVGNADLDPGLFWAFTGQWHGARATADWTPKTWGLLEQMWSIHS
jgi:hypothetical protein